MLHVIKSNEIDTIIGKELGKSDWVLVDQDRIDKFADATMDHQFIHVDPEQANPIFGSRAKYWIGLFRINMNKLMIHCCISKFINSILIN